MTATSAAGSAPSGTATLDLGTINPKAITVTVDNQTRVVGVANPANSFTVSGLVSGDSTATLGTPTYGGSGASADAARAAPLRPCRNTRMGCPGCVIRLPAAVRPMPFPGSLWGTQSTGPCLSEPQMTSTSWSMCVRCLCVLMLAMGMTWGAMNDNDFVPTSGDWNLDSNWSLGHAPLLSEDVTIGAGKTVTVLLTSTPMSIATNSLTVSGALQFTSETASDSIQLTLTTGMTINGEMTVAGPTPTLTIDQENNSDGTSVSPSATVTVAANATLSLAAGTVLYLNKGLQLNNNGTLNLGSQATVTYDENASSGFTQGPSGHLY